MKRKCLLALITPLLFLMSSALLAGELSYAQFIDQNVVNIQKIEQGMTIEQVEEIMGNDFFKYKGRQYNNPWKIKKGDNRVQYWYQTEIHRKFQSIKERICTAVTFDNGVVTSVATFESAPSIYSNRGDSKQSSSTDAAKEKLDLLKSLYDQGVIDEPTYKEQVKRVLSGI